MDIDSFLSEQNTREEIDNKLVYMRRLLSAKTTEQEWLRIDIARLNADIAVQQAKLNRLNQE